MFDISSMIIVFICISSRQKYHVQKKKKTYHQWSSFFVFVSSRDKYNVIDANVTYLSCIMSCGNKIVSNCFKLLWCSTYHLCSSLFMIVSSRVPCRNLMSMIIIVYVCVFQSSVVCSYCRHIIYNHRCLCRSFTIDKYRVFNVQHIIYDHCSSSVSLPDKNTMSMFDISSVIFVLHIFVLQR